MMVVDRLVAELEPLVGEPVRRELLRAEELRGDVPLLHARVAGDLDDLEPVPERLGDRVRVVRGREERDLRQVERRVDVVVLEGRVLRRVEHLEERGGRIAHHVDAELVDLVEDEARGSSRRPSSAPG